MRFLQIADVVNSMTDLMHMSQDGSSPISALQHLQMGSAMSQQQQQSPESLHSMPTVTSVAPHTSPGDTQQQHHPQQLQADQRHHFRPDGNVHLHIAGSVGQNGTARPTLTALRRNSAAALDQMPQQLSLLSPRHSNGSAANVFAQQPPANGSRPMLQHSKRT